VLIVKFSIGVAKLFSKIEPKATIIGTLALIVVALVTYILPEVGWLLCLFATIPGIILWNKSIPSFGLATIVTLVIAVLFGNKIVLSAMILVLISSIVIGQLLKERASKEQILYIATTVASTITIIGFMLLQVFGHIPKAQVLVRTAVKPLEDLLDQAYVQSGMKAEYEQTLSFIIKQLSIQLPSYMIIAIFILILINLLVTFPILRKFKIATPIFKPLFAWQFKRSVLWLYVIDLICVMFATQPSIFQSIVINLQIMLSLLMYIQGLSVIHFFGKAKRMPDVVTIILMVIGTIISPVTHIVALIGVLDLGINLKQIIKKRY